MSTKELNSTTMTTTVTTGTTFVSSARLDVEAEDDEEPPTAVDAADMELVNGSNPWLPAYGFQLQHSSHFQATHEDLRTNDTVLVQQVDFLETILEETSDDLQSDSERSGTTYWVGSDSETESVIHIRAKQRSAEDERLDGSGSDCNSVVPKKRRRKYNGSSDREHQVTFDDYPPSPRSSRSSASSRSSSLLQFESLERTCATLSPSSYSFDSLEYPNRLHANHPENTSPDSLEQDYDKVLPNGFANVVDHFSSIRPYRSFESLDTYQKEEEFGHSGLTNGFAPLYLKRNADLSRTQSNGHHRPRDFWHEDEEYEDDEDDADLDEDDRMLSDNRPSSELDDRLMIFGDSSCNYATSLDYRNTIDLREIGVESKRDALLDLKSGQAVVSSSFRLLQTRLNIASNMAHGRNNMVAEHHHHHYQHHQPQQQLYEQHDLRQHQHQGWSNEECFNFRFTDKSQSAPSLPSIATESAHGLSSLASYASSSRATSFVSTSNLFENYTRVASVPVDLNLCGVQVTHDDTRLSQVSPEEHHEMAEVNSLQGKKRLESLEEVKRNSSEDDGRSKKALTSSVRTQASQNSLEDGKIENSKDEERDMEDCSEDLSKNREKKQHVTSTVKTQDRGNCVLDMAIVMENDIDGIVDEAIVQFKREVEEATSNGNSAVLAAFDGIQRTPSGKQRPWKVKNNASYELAQQFEIDERNFRSNRCRKDICNDNQKSSKNTPGARKRVLNNASYELAQQCDYIKVLQSSRGGFQRMDACDELEESISGRSSQLRVSDIVQQMSSSSTSNLSNLRCSEPYLDTRRYSKSTEDISTQFSMAPFAKIPINELGQRLNKQEEEPLFSQIKKNSDPFSVYGDDPSTRVTVEDEIDFPCLETKPIGTSSLEGPVSREAIVPKPQEQSPKHETVDSSNHPETPSKEPNSDSESMLQASCSKRSFIGDFYPENIVRLQYQEDHDDPFRINNETFEEIEKIESPPSTRLSSSSCNGRNAGELLWRVIVEKQAAENAEKKEASSSSSSMEKVRMVEEKDERKVLARNEREKEKKENEEVTEAARGHTVHGVCSPPLGSGSNSDGLEPSERSGNPAVAVAVDTNHRGDRDKRHEENAKERTVAVRVEDEDKGHGTMSATTTTMKGRSFVGAPSSNMDTSGTKFQRNAVVDSSSVNAAKEERKKGGLGGFLQRFSKLRFSGRSKVPRSEVQKKSDTIGQVNRGKVNEEKSKKKEPDYIIIPLHPPEDEKQKGEENVSFESRTEAGKDRTEVQRSSSSVSANGRAPVSSKPPLPPQPPRVGALSSRPSATSAACSSRRRAATDLGNPAAIEMAKARTMQAAQERPVGLLETDLDEAVPSTTTSVASATGKKTRSLLNLNHTSTTPRSRPEHALHVPQSPVAASHRNPRDDDAASTINQRPHKSMEFLLDKENLHFVKPPENELQKVGERVPSEHELRVQRSLQRLNVPDWYKNSPAARDGFRLKRHSDASQHGGWRALGSKTTSLSSLSSSSNRQPTTGALLSPSPTPPVFSRWSTSLLNSAGSSPASSARSSFNHRQPYLGWRSQERLTNPRTPAERLAQGILPQLQTANKQQQQQQQTTNQQLEVRNSIKEVTSAIVHYVQSGQEVGGGGRLSPRPRPEDWDDRGGARSTSPRGSVKLCWMESSFVGTRPVDSPETPMSLATETDCCPGCNATATESCSCVDSATSGLFLDLTPTHDDSQQQQQQLGGGSLCPSPSSSLNYHQHHHHHHHRQLHHQQQPQQQQRHHRGSGQSDTDEAMATAALLRNKPSPGSTTLEDVLDSLLGLPPASRTPSPGPGPVVTGTSATMRHRTNVGQANAKAGKSCSDLRQDLQESARSAMDVQGATEESASYYVGELVRRKSEGSDSIPSKSVATQSKVGPLRHRRVSFDNNQDASVLTAGNTADKIIRCRNNKCSNSATIAEAKKTYKSCHNCTCLYCSRECRRAHWQRHRRTCLHSRAGSLCKHVLSSAKEDPVTLKHISSLAKRGHASHGRGAVKCFFSSPEAAEKFIANGFVDLGEPTYVRWSDLLASEMGAELYAEVVRLCKSYNPETRLVLYVAVCVVSEVPTTGAVKWERQLVSRCAKIHLDNASRHHPPLSPTSPQGRQQSTSTCNITREMESPEMLVLTSLPGNNGQNTPKTIREISFNNIQRQLKLRGVSLRRHFPQVYRKLRAYVDGTVDKFAPVTIYPRDQASGKSFMCIIMLGVGPERLQTIREISFNDIQRQLKLRGVSLRRHFPQVYRKLRAYVDGTVDKFAPVTIYPRDQASGKSFMCIIMLGVGPERLQTIREISFNDIQRQLKLRGVSLRRHFPQVYRKLRAYVDGTVDKFAPVTIYPRDQASGKSFMCIIMLGVGPERLQVLPTDSSRVRTVDISVEQE